MKRILYGMMFGLLCAVLPAMATVRYVSLTGSGQYSTISAAYTAAVSGDTMLVGPGTYAENPPNHQKRLIWIGAGWDQTVVNWGNVTFFVNNGSSGSSWEGFYFRSTTPQALFQAANIADSISIRRCVLEKSGTQNALIIASSTSCRLYVEDCILIQSTANSVINMPNAATLFRGCVFALTTSNTNACFNGAATTGTTELYNCTFLNFRNIFDLPSGALPVIAINNVFYDWGTTPTFGTYPTGTSIFDYNASETIAAPGTNAISIVANPFVNYVPANNYVFGTSDLHLAVGSALINAGYPSLLDRDGSRSDCGVYGGPRPLVDNGVPNYPWAVNIVLTPNLVGQGTPVNATAIGRVGPQY
jgi:hypothetical protein